MRHGFEASEWQNGRKDSELEVGARSLWKLSEIGEPER